MIKFWKSAAKGKTGCPVRPPELDIQCNFEYKALEIENDGISNFFEKKSQLSLTLHDILIDKKGIKHFVSYMESLSKDLLVKCWLDLQNFQIRIINSFNPNDSDDLKNIHEKKIDHNIADMKLNKESNSDISQTSALKNSCNYIKRTKSEFQLSCIENSHLDLGHSDCDRVESRDCEGITELAISLFKKYVALEAPCKLELSDTVRKIVISNICQPEGRIKEDCFKPVQDALFSLMESTYFEKFLNSPYYIKLQIDILTSRCISLKDILYNETILFYFTEYLEQENCSILLEFLIAVSHFKDNLLYGHNTTPEQAQSDAIILYDKYFSLQATSPIGFPTDIRLKVESDICNEMGPLTTCFDAPYIIIFKTLSNYVKIFLESEIYYTYLSEMIKSVDQLWLANCKSHSDCSSEISVSTQNTLLAMGDPLFKKKRNHSVPDMTIDSNQLYNADSLWQRKKHDGLSLGRINSLGRFESKFEPDPDKNNKSVIKRMVSKLVPTNTTNVKEEMAWQIAHMIVKDITDLTMSASLSDNDHV